MSTTAHPVVPAPGRAAGATSERADSAHRPRGWAWAGVAAGVAGIGTIVTSSMSTAVYDATVQGDAPAIVDVMAGQVPQLIAFHLTTMATVALLPVVAAGLHRRLRATTPADSLTGPVAAIGLVLVAVAALMGSGLDTEFLFAVGEPEVLVPEAAVVFGHWVGTIPWLWVGAGISGVAVAVAALRHRAVPRWLGVVGLVLGGLTLLLGISPLQYMAGMTGPVWLLVTMLGLALGDRRA
ncbi:hypothetical protein [Aquipuribacter nitratireducens]|uniref:DUF4386 family protein n=1 Tax=Aquipuribacter nitratireducens TaxID=650104 RepID=A0ABW0GMH7_9MICO